MVLSALCRQSGMCLALFVLLLGPIGLEMDAMSLVSLPVVHHMFSCDNCS